MASLVKFVSYRNETTNFKDKSIYSNKYSLKVINNKFFKNDKLPNLNIKKPPIFDKFNIKLIINKIDVKSRNINLPKIDKTKNTQILSRSNSQILRRKSTDLANLSFTTFQNLKLEKQKSSYYSLHKSQSTNDYKLAAIKADRNIINNKGFKHYNVPKVSNNIGWASKEKWEITKTGNVCKDIFKSILLGSGNRRDSKAKELIYNRNFKPKNSFLIDSFCLEEGKTLNEMRKSNLSAKKVPLIFNSQCKFPKIVKNKTKTNFIGEIYNPFNYEIIKVKQYNCSLKKSFQKK